MIPVRAYFKLLTNYLRPLRSRVVLLSVVLFGTIGLQLLNPQLIKRFIDGALEGRGASALIPLAITFMLVAVAQQTLAIWSTYLAEDIGWTATNQLRANLTDHVLHLDMGFHKGHSSGELIERIDGDVTALSNFFSAMMIKVVGNGALVVGVLVMLWLESWVVGLSVTIFTALALVGMMGLHRVAVPRWKAVRASAAEAYGFVGEVVEGTEDITANGAAPYMEERFNGILRRWLPQTIRGWMGWAWMWSTTIVLYGLSTSIVFILGSWLFGIGTLTVGSVYLIFHYVEMTRHPMEQIRAQMEDLQKAGAAIDRVGELMETPTKLRAEGDQAINGGALRVEFDDVTFSYADEEEDEIVLHGVSFDIAPGRVVGLLGRTGSGKSTIARLITRLYEPQTGTVRLGDVATGDARVADFRKRVGMVTQDVQLFRASVRDNLTFFNDEVPEERILDAIHRLELDPWLASLPNGLDTLLESGSGGLSAGQAQLLAFTRIFLEDPGVVVLDEASSRLDPATEALIERAVDHLLEGRTGIVIAHRLGTVTRADDILILDDGHVVEFGERSTLAADPESRFSDLLTTGMEEVLA
ncbi:MAG: ABC transporter ATP-binding protein [Actinomycetota bacterium]|nr:ABC transporter ATP-binding protein [Actinomycetota bacterium]